MSLLWLLIGTAFKYVKVILSVTMETITIPISNSKIAQKSSSEKIGALPSFYIFY
jgi:phage-related protein